MNYLKLSMAFFIFFLFSKVHLLNPESTPVDPADIVDPIVVNNFTSNPESVVNQVSPESSAVAVEVLTKVSLEEQIKSEALDIGLKSLSKEYALANCVQPSGIYEPQMAARGEWKSITLSHGVVSDAMPDCGVEIPVLQIQPQLEAEVSVAQKASAGSHEAKRVVTKLRQCVEPGPNSTKNLVAINDLVIKESTTLNYDLQKAIDEIQHITYERDGIIRSGSGKFVGIQSNTDSAKITKIINNFEQGVNQWEKKPDLIYRDIWHDKTRTSPKYQPSKPYNENWDYKIKNEPFNQDLFKHIDLCNRGDLKEAEEILKKYEGFPLTKDGWLKDSSEYRQYTMLRDILGQAHAEKQKVQTSAIKVANEHIMQQAENKMPSVITEQTIKVVNKQDELLFNTQTLEGIDATEIEERIDYRYDALAHIGSTPHLPEFLTQSYALPSYSEALLKEVGIDPVKFTSCYGNAFQQVLHKEHLNIVNQSATRYYQFEQVPEIKDLVSHTLQFVDVAVEFNHAGYIEKSLTITDFCWGLMDVGAGMAEGVWQAAENTAHLVQAAGQAVQHPIETTYKVIDGAKVVARGIKNAGNYFGKLLYYIASEEDDLINPWRYQQRCEKLQSHLARPYRQIVMIDNMLADRLKNMTRRDFAREITSFAVETYLMGRLTSVAGAFVKGSKVKILALAEKVVEKAPEAIALTAEGVPIEAQIVKEGTKDLLRVAEKRIVSGKAGSRNAWEKTKEAVGKVRNTTKIYNMAQFFKECELGKFLKGKVIRVTDEIYRITSKIRYPNLKKGDYFYLDSKHYDHIEVFDKFKNAKAVLNLDGTLNETKTATALLQGRTIKV